MVVCLLRDFLTTSYLNVDCRNTGNKLLHWSPEPVSPWFGSTPHTVEGFDHSCFTICTSAYLGAHCVQVTQTNDLCSAWAEGEEFLVSSRRKTVPAEILPLSNPKFFFLGLRVEEGSHQAIMKASPYSKLKIKMIISEKDRLNVNSSTLLFVF